MSFVYLAENESRTIMKVGMCVNLISRVAGLRTSAHSALTVDAGRFRMLMTLPGGRTKEKRAIKKLSRFLIINRGEWLEHRAEVVEIFSNLGGIYDPTEFRPVHPQEKRLKIERWMLMWPCRWCGKKMGKLDRYRHEPHCPKRKKSAA